MKLSQLLGMGILTLGVVGASSAAGDADPLRALLEESRAQQKGITFFVQGAQVPGVVLSFTDKHVTARSQAHGTLVIRLDRIDAVAGFISPR